MKKIKLLKSIYFAFHSKDAFSILLFPTLWITKHMDFFNGEAGTGVKPSIHHFKLTFGLLAWQASLSIQFRKEGFNGR